MFDFEKLVVYQKALGLVKEVLFWLGQTRGVDEVLSKQLKRASTSILFNIAEGTGRLALADKKHFYTIARGSVFETASILQLLSAMDKLDPTASKKQQETLVEISKMLLALIRSCKPQP